MNETQDRLFRRFSKVIGPEGRVLNLDGRSLWDLSAQDYANFLENTHDLPELIQGLTLLSPLADDALAVAQSMTNLDFGEFKLALIYERNSAKEECGDSKMPNRYYPLMLPENLVHGGLLGPTFSVTAGAAASWRMYLQHET